MGIFNTNSYDTQVSYDSIPMKGTDAEFENILIESYRDTYQLEAGLYIADILMEQKVVMESANAEVLLEAVAGNLFERIRTLFKNIWSKIKSWFEAFVKNIKMMMVSGKKFIKEFGSELRKKNVTGFKYMGYEYSSDYEKIDTIYDKCISVVGREVDDLDYTQATKLDSGSTIEPKNRIKNAANGAGASAHLGSDTSESLTEWKEGICKQIHEGSTTPEEITSEMTELLGSKVECEDFNNLDKSTMITIVEKSEKIIAEVNKSYKDYEKHVNKIISNVNKLEKEFKDVDEAMKGKVTSVITAITSRLSFLLTIGSSCTKTFANLLQLQAKDCEATLKAYIRFRPKKAVKESAGEESFENILESALNFI